MRVALASFSPPPLSPYHMYVSCSRTSKSLSTATQLALEHASTTFSFSLMYSLFGRLLFGLLLLSLSSTVYLYSYPIFHRCAFPKQPSPTGSARSGSADAPFRLLALGDPQLEGDSSLLNFDNGFFPSLQTLGADVANAGTLLDFLYVVHDSWRELLTSDLPRLLRSYRKRLDLWGNDYYLAHIYRTVHWFTSPTHVTVLGDLLGSQWVDDAEFERRGWRYWNRVFRHGQRVEDEITNIRHLDILGRDKSWEKRVINIVGNHDVGYAGDLTLERMQRFERVFGKANWEARFVSSEENYRDLASLESAGLPELRIVVLNSLNLDTPALSQDLQADTYKFINDVIGTSRPVEDRTTATIVLTHLPIHKEAGVCVDSPYFDFHSEEQGGGVKEQNHLSYNAGTGIFEGIFGMSGNLNGPGGGYGRNGVILTGHDHEGCDVYHYLPDDHMMDSRIWKAERWDDSEARLNGTRPGIREITLQSMMGEFGGNAGLLSAWFDHNEGEWKTEYSTCLLGTQHIWWAVHVLDIIAVFVMLIVGWNSHQSLDIKGSKGRKAMRPSGRQKVDKRHGVEGRAVAVSAVAVSEETREPSLKRRIRIGT